MVGLDIYVPNGAFTLDVKSMLNEDLVLNQSLNEDVLFRILHFLLWHHGFSAQ
jgi:hypothetical protein